MKGKRMAFINLGLAVTMLFFALPRLGVAETSLGNAFWIVWTVLAAVVVAASGNVILMSEEKRERLLALKRYKALKLERKLSSSLMKQATRKKERVRDTA